MQSPEVIIYRHRKENTKKCSLQPLVGRPGWTFFTYPKEPLVCPKKTVVLSMNAPLLTTKDRHRPLLVIDGTWRYAQLMQRQTPLIQDLEERSLPEGIKTAYPRKQEDCPDPTAGLASIEALYIAYVILGWDTEGLLDSYHFSKAFLISNAELIASLK